MPEYTVNQDGSLSMKDGDKTTKYVKESDLLAVKGASESARKEYEAAIAKHQADIDAANQARDVEHQLVIQERTAKEQLVNQSTEFAALKTKAGELETKFTAADGSRKKLEDELLGIKRSTFIERYKIDKDKVKDINLDQLRQMESNFAALGLQPAGKLPANFDGGDHSQHGAIPLNSMEHCKAELQLARELAAKKSKGG